MTGGERGIKDALVRASGGKSVRQLAQALGVSKTLVDRFLRGERSIDIDPLYTAIYRTYPEIRWLLEDHQRKTALGEELVEKR